MTIRWKDFRVLPTAIIDHDPGDEHEPPAFRIRPGFGYTCPRCGASYDPPDGMGKAGLWATGAQMRNEERGSLYCRSCPETPTVAA